MNQNVHTLCRVYLIWISLLCIICAFPINGMSQTQDTIPVSANVAVSDSLSAIELEGVVVKARMHRTDASSSTFTPTTNQKTSAQNAVDLLKQLVFYTLYSCPPSP